MQTYRYSACRRYWLLLLAGCCVTVRLSACVTASAACTLARALCPHCCPRAWRRLPAHLHTLPAHCHTGTCIAGAHLVACSSVPPCRHIQLVQYGCLVKPGYVGAVGSNADCGCCSGLARHHGGHMAPTTSAGTPGCTGAWPPPTLGGLPPTVCHPCGDGCGRPTHPRPRAWRPSCTWTRTRARWAPRTWPLMYLPCALPSAHLLLHPGPCRMAYLRAAPCV